MSYCRARLGAPGLAMARALLPLIGASLLSDQKEFALLVGKERFEQAMAAFNVTALVDGCTDAPFWLDDVSPVTLPA